MIMNQGISQEAFAKTIGVNRAVISQIELEKQLPILKQLEHISNSFDATYDWLLYGHDDMLNKKRSSHYLKEYNAVSQEKPSVGRKPIPLIPAEAFAGLSSGEVSISEQDIKEKYVIPEFRDADFVIRIMIVRKVTTS